MSRSRRKTPIIPITTSEGEGSYKQQEAKRERRKVHQLLQAGRWDDLPDPVEYGNPWKGPKDGKQYFIEDDGRK